MGLDDFLPASSKDKPAEPPQDQESIPPALPGTPREGDELFGSELDFSPDLEDAIQLDPDGTPDIVLGEQDDDAEPEDERPAEVQAAQEAGDEDESEIATAEELEATAETAASEVEAQAVEARAAEPQEAEVNLAEAQEAEANAAEPQEAEVNAAEAREAEANAPEPQEAEAAQQAPIAAEPAVPEATVDEVPQESGGEATPASPPPATGEAAEDPLPSEDLFDFDQPLDQAPPPPPPAAEEPTAAPEPEVAPAAESSTAPEPEEPEPVVEVVPAAPAQPSKAGMRVTPLVGAAFVLLLISNLAVLVTTWRSQSMAQSYVTQIGNQMLLSAEEMREEGERRTQSLREVAQMMAEPREHGYEILDAIDMDIQRGELERARRSLYALIAIGDSLEPSVREDIVARASFRIGDTYRLQTSGMLDGEVSEP